MIAPAGPAADWAAVHALLTAAFAGMAGRIDPPSSLTRMGPEALRALAAEGSCLLAHGAGALTGCLFAKPQGATQYLSKIAVAPAAQGRGVGAALVAAAATRAQAAGAAALVLESRVQLAESHAAFRAMGFVEVGRTAHPGYDQPTSITFRKPL